MKATQLLHNLGQSIWLDNITRDLLISGTLKRYIDELSITGLTSNPTIFDHAITKSQAYDAAIRQKIRQDKSDEELFFDLAIALGAMRGVKRISIRRLRARPCAVLLLVIGWYSP